MSNDLTVNASYFEAQENFNPELRFIPRRDVEKYSGNVNYRPRLNSHGIRNFFFGSRVDYFQSSSGNDMETRRKSFNGGISFQNNAFFNFNVNRPFERLDAPFPIRSDIEIPAGDYQFNDINIFYNSDRSKKTGGNVFFNFGNFWNGTKKSIGEELALRPNHRINIDVKQFSSNIRFRLIHHPLSEMFIVYNDRRDTQTNELLDRAIILKFTNLFNF